MNLPKLLLSLKLSIVALFVGSKVLAQDFSENNFTLYTKQQGLSHNTITGIAQDSTGYMWITTLAGLNRFNGGNFVQFHSGNDSVSLPQENLSGLAWLDKKRLAIYTAEGLHIIDTKTGATKNVIVPYADRQYQYKFNGVNAASGNTSGDVFVLTRSGFYHYDKDYHLVLRFDYYETGRVPTAHFIFGSGLVWLDKDHLAVISNGGIYIYNILARQFRKMNASDYPLLKEFLDYPKTQFQFFQPRTNCFFVLNTRGDSLFYIDIARNKRTLIRLPHGMAAEEFDIRSKMYAVSDSLFCITGGNVGLFKIKIDVSSAEAFFDTTKYFPSYVCRVMFSDRDHNLWIATNKGLLRQDIGQVLVQQAMLPSSLLDAMPGITIDDAYSAGDKIYVATRNGGGLFVFDRQLHFIKRISFEKYPNVDNNVLCMAGINAAGLLLGTGGPLMKMDISNGSMQEIALEGMDKSGEWIIDLCKDRNNNVWVVSASSNVYKYDISTNTASLVLSEKDLADKIQSAIRINVDAVGNIWISGNGMCRYNVSTNKIDRVIDSFPFIRIPDKRITIFAADRQNNLWINSNNNGLTCYNIDKETFTHFTRDNGLPDNNLDAMLVVKDKLWMASFSGISCLDLSTYRISRFTLDDGFPDLPTAKNSKFFYDTATDKLYIGFTNTLVKFDPGIVFQRSQAPHLFIESIMTGDQKKTLFPGENFTTDWRNNVITITIGSINFYSSNSQHFAYKLMEEDSSHWQQLGTQNIFSILNLAPGKHHIQVKLFSINNRWPEQVQDIQIIVSPPFWKQAWFMLVSMIFLVVSTYLLLRWRTDVIRKKEQINTHIQELKAEEYKSQYELEQISHYFSTSLAGKKNAEEVLWDVAKNLIGRMNYEDCMIYLWNEDKTKMVQKAAYGPKGDPKAISTKQFDVLPGQGVVGRVMQTKEPLMIPDTRWDGRYRVDDIRRLSELCVPIIHNNELIGIIDSEHPDENHFKERDIKILTTIATLVGNKIKQIESEQSLEIKQKEISLINLQLAEAQLSALQTQMNPHFVFNSLNSIKGMILANEQQKASRYLSKFAQLIRITLNQSKEIFTTLYENIEHLESYLMMEKLRFDDSFTFRITVDDQLDKEDILIPTMMMQPLAENAIWHGLLHKEGEKKLLIRFSRVEETISCSIEDNGIGINRSEELKKINRPPHQSVGLNNLRNRIKIMNEKYDTGCTLTITDMQDLNIPKTGTRAVLRFNIISPLIKHNYESDPG